ncbi:hypothetical protein RF11_13727 [Thelohanellus kitauei]|uniref:Uncharacterized protein n=1 Tax=Thelohanellus kitauei TaxID=669202 RepID=A0A0C2MHS9_THEKT|nr:hypothetical protein RF11_13727 [Thelohanellus kitauei]
MLHASSAWKIGIYETKSLNYRLLLLTSIPTWSEVEAVKYLVRIIAGRSSAAEDNRLFDSTISVARYATAYMIGRSALKSRYEQNDAVGMIVISETTKIVQAFETNHEFYFRIKAGIFNL